jgi:hypothetical protein
LIPKFRYQCVLYRWFNITELILRKLKSRILRGPFTVQLGTRVLTNFEINLASSLLNFVRQAVPEPLIFFNYYRPGLLFADFGDAKTLIRWTRTSTSIHIGLLLSCRCWVTCQCPALDSLLDSFYSGGGVVSHLLGFPSFRALASTRVPRYICPDKAEVSKRQYSSKAKSCNVHYFVPPIRTVLYT